MLMVAMDITLFSQNKEICLFMKIYPQKIFWTLDPRKFILQIFFVFPFLLYFYSFFSSSGNWPFYVHFNWTEILNGFYSINTCKAFVTPSLLNSVLGVLAWSSALRGYAVACSRAWRVCVLTCLRAWRVCVLDGFACLALSYVWRACMLACLACFCIRVLCLRAFYDACLACLTLAYSRFCLIIHFVCINQDFAIKGKLLIHVNLS